MTVQRQRILDDLERTLRAITVANGYLTTIKTVDRRALDADDDEVGIGALPWIGFWPGREQREYEPGNQMKVTMLVSFLFHVTADTPTARSIALSNLQDDLTRALAVDTRRGGNASSTTLGDGDTSEGQDYVGKDGAISSMLLESTIIYFRSSKESS